VQRHGVSRRPRSKRWATLDWNSSSSCFGDNRKPLYIWRHLDVDVRLEDGKFVRDVPVDYFRA
jgi:hypothetical protein